MMARETTMLVCPECSAVIVSEAIHARFHGSVETGAFLASLVKDGEDEDSLMTPREARDALGGIADSTLRRLIEDGVLVRVHLGPSGSRYMLRRSQVQALIKGEK